jgi:hypothetical protein
MSGLAGLASLLDDPELRTLAGEVVSRKITADLKAIEAYAELARKLTDNRRRGDGGDTLKQVVREHLGYYGTLVAISHSFHDRLLDMLTVPPGEAGPAVNGTVLSLSAGPGATARGAFSVLNGRAEAVSVDCRSSPFVSEDGSQLVASTITFDPGVAVIPAGADVTFAVVVPVGPELLAGRTYFANLGADGVEDFNVVLRLTVTDAPAQDQADAEGPRPKTPRKAAAKRSRGRSGKT